MTQPKLNWSKARNEYVWGNESFQQLAARYGIKKKSVERHALNRRANAGCTWGQLRTKYRARISKERLRKAARTEIKNARLRLLNTKRFY